MKIDPDRKVSTVAPGFTMLQAVTVAKTERGLVIQWSHRDHKLNRFCRDMFGKGYFKCTRRAFGVSIYKIDAKWPGFVSTSKQKD